MASRYMRSSKGVLIAASLVGLCGGTGCNPRKPLARSGDGGPSVEMVEAKPLPIGSAPKPLVPAIPLVDEHEPNDDPEHAQLLEAGKGIRGSLAAPTSMGAGKGNDDYFAYTSPPTVQQVRIEVTGSPAADLQLELLDSKGQRLALVDEGRHGEAERLQNLVLAPNLLFYVRVKGTVAATGQKPGEHEYQLSLQQLPAPLGSEQEPNDTPLLATAAVGADLNGALQFRRDEDYWVVALPEALGHRAPEPGGTTEGIRTPAVLRVELTSPGVVPSVRVFYQMAPLPRLPAAAAAATADAGASPVTDGGTSAAPVLTPLADVGASKGAQELRLRNLTIPAGSVRAYVAVRGLSFPRPPGDARYHLRLTVEPELEDAEVEPNDDCAQATAVKLAATSGGRGEGDIAGFLWPGDIDCFVLRPANKSAAHWQIKLALPGGDCQAALELVRGGEPPAKASAASAGGIELHARGDVVVRVSSRERKTCFEAPYRLTATTEPEPAGAQP